MSHHHNHHYHGPPPPPYAPHPPGSYAHISTGVPSMFPTPTPPPPAQQPLHVINYVYQRPTSLTQPVHVQPEPVVHTPVPDVIDWVPTTPSGASSLAHRAYIGGKEGWDGGPLWIIRAHNNGDLVPGKFAVKHRGAYIPQATRELPVHNFEVLCAAPHVLHWVQASHGQIPAGAFPAGNTSRGEPLYIGRFRHLFSLTPGKVHPSHNCCYISYGGKEISQKHYEVLCKVDMNWR